MKRAFFLMLFIGFLCPSFGFSEDIPPVEFPVPLMSEPVYYDGSFFAFTSPTLFSRLDKKGHIEWQITKLASQVKEIKIQFNCIFLLYSSGALDCYDAKMGYRLWVSSGGDIQSMKVSYPTLYFLNSNGCIGTLDFQTGQFTGLSTDVWMGPDKRSSKVAELKQLLGDKFDYKGTSSIFHGLKVEDKVFLFIKK